MKKPILLIDAQCDRHGAFRLQKPPKSSFAVEGQGPFPFYPAVTCPKCRTWATILQQTLITEDAEPIHEQLALAGVTHG